MADLYLHGDLDKYAAVFNLALAVGAALLSKVLILGFMNRGRFALVLSSILGLMVAAGFTVLFFVLKVSK